MKNIRAAANLALAVFLAGSATAAPSLIPEPKQMRAGRGEFLITAATRIEIGAADAAEDRVAAEMLAQEIESVTHRRVPIVVVASGKAGAGAISLLRANGRFEPPGLSTAAIWNAQGYRLESDEGHVAVVAAGAAGLFYGAQTLRQLLIPAGRRLACPAVSIADWPSMAWRGVHVDLSRGPIPTLEYMKKQVRTLSEYKINLYALYLERVFDYRSQLLKHDDGALTAAEVSDLVSYAKKYHVVILPEQQAFGHMHKLLKYDIYSALAETPHGHVLAPVQEGSYDLIAGMYAELAPLFPDPFFHIGCDETFELGSGQSQARAREAGPGRLYLDHLQRVHEIMRPYHKRLLFWGDIAVKYPDLLGVLPKDMIAVPWGYDLDTDYAAITKPYKDAGFDFIVSPGASNWNRVWPDFDIAFANIRDFASAGQKLGALGLLNTTWNDDGESLLETTWPALALGAAASWQPAAISTAAFAASYDWAFYRNPSGDFREALEDLDRVHVLLRSAGLDGAMNDAYWRDPFTEAGARYTRKVLPVAREIRLSSERALEALGRGRPVLHADTIAALAFAAMRLDSFGMKIEFADEISRFYRDAYEHQGDRARVARDLEEISDTDARLEDLRDDVARLRGFYSAAWQKEYRPYWMANVLIRYDQLAGLYQSKIGAVRAVRQDFEDGAKLPAPETLGFF
ncbi:MAG: beta-N-acetylhexosaminidase [Elusimicrobiota bacterium]